MTPRFVLSAVCGLVLGLGAGARAEGCPEARGERLRGAFAAAEHAARGCLAADAEDVGTWLELSRALGYQRRFEEALHWVERGLERYPADTDLSLWRVRLLAWSGRLPEAQGAFGAVLVGAPELAADPETAALGDDLEAWSARVTTIVEAGAATSARMDELRSGVTVLGRVWDALRLGLGAELRVRDDGAEVVGDTVATGLVAYQGEGWSVEGGLGVGLGATFSPALSAWVEPGLALAAPLWLHVRAWRLTYADAGAWVVAPGVVIDADPWSLDVRYWLGLDDAGGLGHAALLRARLRLGDWVIEGGGGGGNARDYLDPGAAAGGGASDGGGHWLALAGLRWSPSWRHALRVGWIVRQEVASTLGALTRHEVTLAWQLRW